MRRIVVSCAVVAALALVPAISRAQEPSPDVLLKAATADVLVIVKRGRGHMNAGRTNEVNDLVERKILPLFNFARMAQSALARNWTLASPDQRNALIAEFRTLLVRTYATAMRNYRDEIIDFKLLKLESGASEATVRSVVLQSGIAKVAIDYDMEKTAAGWKVHEIRMDGVNLIENYRPGFAAKVRDVGIDGLIKALADKNRQDG